MTKSIFLLLACVAVSPAFAQKSCDELKTEIAAKLDGKGLKGYQLDVVANDAVKDQKAVGSCDNGSKKIVYKKS